MPKVIRRKKKCGRVMADHTLSLTWPIPGYLKVGVVSIIPLIAVIAHAKQTLSLEEFRLSLDLSQPDKTSTADKQRGPILFFLFFFTSN